MNTKKFIIASLVVFVLYEVLSYLIHGVILSKAYMDTADLWRSMEDMNSKSWIMWVGDLVKAFLFVYIFIKGLENKGWMEGVRFGVVFGLYVGIGMGIGTYATSPIPFTLALQWFAFTVVQLVLCGIAAALIYKPKKPKV